MKRFFQICCTVAVFAGLVGMNVACSGNQPTMPDNVTPKPNEQPKTEKLEPLENPE